MIFSFFKKLPALPALRFHNTLSGEREVFVPLLPGQVKMYNCGPTPYDRQHIGNLFPPVVVNVLRRTLEIWGHRVKQVTNITDFGHLTSDADEGEDKMTKGLKREGLALTHENMRVLAEKYTKIFLEDLRLLGVDTNSITFPRASDYIPDQIALIKTLEEKSYAYKTKNGVYFDISRFPGYGKLGGINLAGLKEGARVEKNLEKRNPFDFALWKLNRKLGWESPWGKGFPGWHIECTAMIFKLLGKQIDIHTGGIEHIPVHHNNEIAQAESATGKQYVRYWLHNAHITIEGKKVAKSLGNTIYLSQIIDRGLSPLVLRYWYLTGHYRTPMNFTWEALEGASQALTRLTRLYLEFDTRKETADKAFLKDFYAAMANDLDTPKALARVWELVKDNTLSPATKRASLLEADKILGLGLSDERPMQKLAVIPESKLPGEVQKLLLEREVARADKDFTKADTLRGQVETLGYTIKDTPEGPRVSKN